MTISSEDRSTAPFAGNGVATSFPFAFKVFAASDLVVVLTDADGVDNVLVLDSDYSVTLNPDQDNNPGGSITYPIIGSPLAVGESLIAYGDITYLQPADIVNQSGFYPRVVENALDRATMLIQQVLGLARRAIRVPVSAANVNTELPDIAQRAGRVVAFDDDGNVIVSAKTLLEIEGNADIREGSRTTQQYVATAGQTSVDTIYNFIPGADQVAVNVNGSRLVPGVDYTETDPNTITFTQPLQEGDAILVELFGRTTNFVDAMNVGYGTGTVADALESLGVSLDSYPGADDDAKMAAAVADLTGTGRTLHIPSRVVSLTAPVVVEGFRIAGQGNYDWQQVTRWGSVFSLGGALNSSSSNVFTVSDGGAIEGCVFYYPSQVPNVSTPAITPAGYVIYIDGVVTQRGATVANNWIVNGYNCIKNDDGTSKIIGNWICALNEGITDTQYLTEHHIALNSIGFVNWYQSIGQPIRDYMGANAIAFRMIASAATLTANHVFGVRDGIRLEGPFPFLSVNGGIYDGCRFTIRGIAGCGNGELRCNNAYLASNTVVFGNNTTSAAVTLESNCVRFDDPTGGDVDLIFNGCKIGGANGHLFRVSAATGKVNVVVDGNKIVNPGRFAHTLLIGVSGVTGTFQNGEIVTSGGASATFLKLDGSTMYVSSDTGTFVVAGTITGGTSGATATITSVTDGPVYRALQFDCPNGNLNVSGNEVSFARYRFNGGVYVINGKDVKVVGNGFTSPFSTSQPMVQVDNARSLIEGLNSSDVPGTSFSDVIIGTITREPALGPSSWSRRITAFVDGRSFVQAAISTPQAITDATLTTIAFNNEQKDNRGEYAPATGIFTAAEGGLYNVSGSLPYANTATAGDMWAILLVSTSRTKRYDYVIPAAVNGSVQFNEVAFELLPGDTIRLQVQRITGAGSFTTRATGSSLRIVKAR